MLKSKKTQIKTFKILLYNAIIYFCEDIES